MGIFIDNLHLVAAYANMTVLEALELPVVYFGFAYGQAVVARLQETPEGQQLLETYERLQITECDTDKLREVFGDGKRRT